MNTPSVDRSKKTPDHTDRQPTDHTHNKTNLLTTKQQQPTTGNLALTNKPATTQPTAEVYTYKEGYRQTRNKITTRSARATQRRLHAHLVVKQSPVHHAAAEDYPLRGDDEDKAGAKAGERVGGCLPDGVAVGHVGKVLPLAVLC